MTVRPFLRPAHAVAREVIELRTRVNRATSDGVVTATEKRNILKKTDAVTAHAQALTETQGDSVVDAVADLARMTRQGKLVLHGDDAVNDLVVAKDRMWKDAKAQMNHNPFPGTIGKIGERGVKAPFTGVRTRDFTWEGKRIHLVAVDLANPKVHAQTTSQAERGRNVDDLARRHGAEVAINGDFFSYGSYKPSGRAMHAGKPWGTEAATWESGLVWKGQHAQIQRSSAHPASWAKNVVSARPNVLHDGRRTDYPEADKAVPNRRTGLGLSQSGRVLFLVAAEGGLSAKDLGRLLRQQGAHDGFALDSGGSAQLYQRGRGMVQASSDAGGRRRVANALLINVDG